MPQSVLVTGEKCSGASPAHSAKCSHTNSVDVSACLAAGKDDRPYVVSPNAHGNIVPTNSSKNNCIYLLYVVIVVSVILNVYTLALFFKLEREFTELQCLVSERINDINVKQKFHTQDKPSVIDHLNSQIVEGDRPKPWDESRALPNSDSNLSPNDDAQNNLIQRKRRAIDSELDDRRRRRNNRRRNQQASQPTSQATTRAKRDDSGREPDVVPTATRHQKADHAAAHYEATPRLQHTTDSNGGYYTNWRRTEWDMRSVTLIEMQSGKAQIKAAGVYLIYAQVTFNDPSRNRVGFAIQKTGAGGNKTLAKCIQTFPTLDVLSARARRRIENNANTCYTSSVHHLAENDSIYVMQYYHVGNARVCDEGADMKGEIECEGSETFWGLIRLY